MSLTSVVLIGIFIFVECYGVGLKELSQDLMVNAFGYLSVEEGINASVVSKSLYNSWKAQNKHVLLDFVFLDDLALIINDTVFDTEAMAKIEDIHHKYSRNLNALYLSKSANWIKKNFNFLHGDSNNTSIKHRNAEKILDIIIPETIGMFEQLRTEFLNSSSINPFDANKLTAFKAIGSALSFVTLLNWTDTVRQKLINLKYDYNFILNYIKKVHMLSIRGYLHPPLAASIQSIRYRYHPQNRVGSSIYKTYTIKLRARYIVHCLRTPSIEMENHASIIHEIRVIMQQLKILNIEDMLTMIRCEIKRYCSIRNFGHPLVMELLNIYLIWRQY